jgi:hypothetical protein
MMANYLAQTQPLRQRTSALSERLDKVMEQAGSNKWPHCALNASVRIYAQKMCAVASVHLHVVAEELQLPWQSIEQPLTETHDRRLERHFRELAEETNYAEAQVAEATFAACKTQLKIAADLVTHLEACIDGHQNIDGQVIARGELWDK